MLINNEKFVLETPLEFPVGAKLKILRKSVKVMSVTDKNMNGD